MLALIVFRAVQGLGAGAVQPTAMTIVGDIYTVAERARVQGYLASVWAVSSVVGPMLGGAFSQLGIWRGVFLINIPLCLVAAWMFNRHFHETVTRRHRSVDSLGALLLASAMTALVLGVLGGGQSWAWNSAPSIARVHGRRRAVGGVRVRGASGAPSRSCRCGCSPAGCCVRRRSSAFGVGAILMGLTSYVPTYPGGLAAGSNPSSRASRWPR